MQTEQAPATIQTPAEQVVFLEDLARQANEHYEEAGSKASRAKSAVNEAVTAALLCGKALNDAKEILPHGKFLSWLQTYCPNISRMTASKYMRLSNVNHGLHLDSAKGLRQAYQLCGIIPEDEKSPSTTTSDSAETQVFNFRPIANGAHVLIRASERLEAVSGLSPEDKDELRIELERAEHAVGILLAALRGEEMGEFTSDSQILNPEAQ